MTTRKQPRARPPLTPLETYFREINRTPLLSADEEKELARRIQTGDQQARDLMVRANLRLVVRLACRYARRGCALEDLISEGNVGLVKAADRYNPSRNTRFSTYAFYWIRLAIQQVLNTVKIIRLSNHMTALCSKWSRAAAALQAELGRIPTEAEVADRLDLAPERVPAIQHALHIARMEPRSVEGDGENALGDHLLDARAHGPDLNAGETEVRHQMGELLANLSEREARVLRLRFGLDSEDPHTLQAIARGMGVTRERVRQIEIRALNKLRAKMEETTGPATPDGGDC